MKYVVTLNGKNYEVEVNETEAVLVSVSDAATVAAPVAAPAAPVAAPATPAAAPAVSAEGTTIPSPMPGTILSVSVSVGQTIKSGDVLMVLEAMKMENDIVAPCDGTVKQILVSRGSTVNTDDVLIVI
ncbi:MAG: biotin/lipoyl-binding protein [Ruminococcaceae bacterium]|nr:biotin/lipoyl-binding protein [Oscillospiraceae bacterium]